MTNIWENCYNIGWGKNLVPEAFSHPAKVSFSLAGKIYNHAINMGWVKKGDTVLDPFTGSSTTGVASVRNGRRFIGIDTNAEYLELSVTRLDEELARIGDKPRLVKELA